VVTPGTTKQMQLIERKGRVDTDAQQTSTVELPSKQNKLSSAQWHNKQKYQSTSVPQDA